MCTIRTSIDKRASMASGVIGTTVDVDLVKLDAGVGWNFVTATRYTALCIVTAIFPL